MDYAELTDVQKAQLEEAFDRQMTGQLIRGTEEDHLMFGAYQPLAVTRSQAKPAGRAGNPPGTTPGNALPHGRSSLTYNRDSGRELLHRERILSRTHKGVVYLLLVASHGGRVR